MHDRNMFMAWCIDNRYEFSSWRRARFSTMCMLYNLQLNNLPNDQDDSKKADIDRCIELLKHACVCHDPHCQYKSCKKMKTVLQHSKKCGERSAGTCETCNKLVAIICSHAKRCAATRCPVPFCLVVRLKRSEQMLALKLRDRLEQRRLTATRVRSTH